MLLLWLGAAMMAQAGSADAAFERQRVLPDANASAVLADELIALVNAMRSERGLAQISAHPILMQVAQTHADYMAATGQITHYSADGKRPFQRALEAGFPVAGDLSLGGFYSENIVAGGDMSPQQAFEIWMGDEPHRNTMFSEYRSHLGAGVAVVDGLVYYVLDTALYSSAPVSQTVVVQEAPTEGVILAPISRNTPAGDGSIVHTVRVGETLWAIAAIYDLTVDQLIELNGLTSDQFIFPDDELIIQPSQTPTMTPIPTSRSTNTARVTSSPRPSSTPAASLTSENTPAVLQDEAEDRDFLGIIVPIVMALAVILLVVILRHGIRSGSAG